MSTVSQCSLPLGDSPTAANGSESALAYLGRAPEQLCTFQPAQKGKKRPSLAQTYAFTDLICLFFLHEQACGSHVVFGCSALVCTCGDRYWHSFRGLFCVKVIHHMVNERYFAYSGCWFELLSLSNVMARFKQTTRGQCVISVLSHLWTISMCVVSSGV